MSISSFSGIFIWILNRSISASYLIAVVLLLRLLFKKAPKWISCLMFAICAIKLVIPFSIEAEFSLIPSSETVPYYVINQNYPEISSGIDVIDNSFNSYLRGFYFEGVSVAKGTMQNITDIAFVVWMVGVVLLIAYIAVSFVRLNISLKNSSKLSKGVYENSGVKSPFILGVFSPKIFLPKELDNKTSEYVLKHEKAHLSRFDHIAKPLAFVISSVYWFNPLVWIAYSLFCKDIELACDEKVIKELDAEERADYAQSLLYCAVSKKRILSCPLAFGEIGIKERIKKTLSYKKPLLWVLMVCIICASLVAVLFLSDPVSKGVIGGVNVLDSGCENKDISFDFSSISLDKDNSYIEVVIGNNTSDEQGYGEEFTLHRKEKNGDFINCDLGATFIMPYYIIDPHSNTTHKFHLDNFDVYKEGHYRFETIMGGGYKAYIEFELNEIKNIQNNTPVAFDASIYDVGWGGEEGKEYFKKNCVNSENVLKGESLPIIRVKNRDELNEVYDGLKENFPNIGAGYQQMKAFEFCIENCGLEFFETNELLLIYIEEGSCSIKHRISGVEIGKKGELCLNIDRLSPEVGDCAMAGKIITCTVEKKFSQNINSFDAKTKTINIQYE